MVTHATLGLLAGALALTACAATAQQPAAPPVNPEVTHFWNKPGLSLGQPAAALLLNENKSPRISEPQFFAHFVKKLGPLVERNARDPRINLNPNYLAALMAKESGFDPRATSHVPANGIAQVTHIADADLRIIAEKAPAFRWMHKEVSSWPRSPVVHRATASKALTDSLLRAGKLSARSEYLFDPEKSIRGAMFWLRILATIWTEDEWPGANGSFARQTLNGGQPLNEHQLMQLVTVSYNQGHPYVKDLLEKHGERWTEYLNEEAGDYLARISEYILIYQRAAIGSTD